MAKECGWDGCQVQIPVRKGDWCDEHRGPGRKLRRAGTQARYNAGHRELVAQAKAPQTEADGAVLLPPPLAESLRADTDRLATSLAEYDRAVAVFIGWDHHAHLEGWADLKRDHEERLRWAVSALTDAARACTASFGSALQEDPDPQA